MILNCELLTFKKIKIINSKKFGKWPVQTISESKMEWGIEP